MKVFAFEKVLVAALLLSLAAIPLWAAAAGEEQTAVAAAAPGEPQYGGTLTVVTFKTHDESVRWDATLGKYVTNTFQSPFSESLLVGDVDTHGPRLWRVQVQRHRVCPAAVHARSACRKLGDHQRSSRHHLPHPSGRHVDRE